MLKFAGVSTLLLACAAIAPAQAATLDITSFNANVFADPDGGNQWYSVSAMQVGTQTFDTIYAGAFRLTAEDGPSALASFLAFCLEPLNPLHMPQTYAYGSVMSETITQDLQILAAHAMPLVTDARSAAAFQMAAWEITTETGAYDVDDGFFQITGTGDASNAAELLAQDWLDLVSVTEFDAGGRQYQIFNAEGVQDLLTNVELAAVPLPASSLLLLCSLAGLGGVSARRRRT